MAIDYDPVVVGELWRNAAGQKLDILPLVVNVTRPSPGVGWMNHECSSFFERARGSFDLVMMLAVIHHMLVSERVPLDEIVRMAAELTTDRPGGLDVPPAHKGTRGTPSGFERRALRSGWQAVF